MKDQGEDMLYCHGEDNFRRFRVSYQKSNGGYKLFKIILGIILYIISNNC